MSSYGATTASLRKRIEEFRKGVAAWSSAAPESSKMAAAVKAMEDDLMAEWKAKPDYRADALRYGTVRSAGAVMWTPEPATKTLRMELAIEVLKALLPVRPNQVMLPEELVAEAYTYADALLKQSRKP